MSGRIEIHQNTSIWNLDVSAYAHGVNCMGLMGAGIAKQFRERYPENYKLYKEHCSHEMNEWWGVFPTFEKDVHILNLASQRQPGKDATLERVRIAFAGMFDYAESTSDFLDKPTITSIAMPLIGCGIGGLKWDDVFEELIQMNDLSDYNGEIHIAIK